MFFSDTRAITDLIPDPKKDNCLDGKDIKAVLTDEKIKYQLRNFVVEHPSEWHCFDAIKDSKWETFNHRSILNRLMKDEDEYPAFLETVRKLSFLDQVNGFTENEKLWYFHPIAFVQHLKRLSDHLITIEMLECAVHNGDKDYFKQIILHLNTYAEVYSVNTPLRIAHFLSQVGHESGFRVVEENLNYRVSTMQKIFGCKRNKWRNGTCAEEDRISTRPRLWTHPEEYRGSLANRIKLANYVYKDRMGNGNEASGDGYKYRGRGIIQLTGKNNYINYTRIHNEKNPDDVQDFVTNPDLIINNIKYGIESAFVWWDMNDVNKLCSGE